MLSIKTCLIKALNQFSKLARDKAQFKKCKFKYLLMNWTEAIKLV